jgi:hypothetical protein
MKHEVITAMNVSVLVFLVVVLYGGTYCLSSFMVLSLKDEAWS